MMKALLRIRFKALFAGLMRQGKQRKKSNAGMIVLLIFLYLYVAVVLCGAMGVLFFSLAEPYHTLGLDWLYFAMAGLMGFGFAVLGSVFTTQSQLYDAKDNDMLLAMPLRPGQILLSRMLPLLALNLLFTAMVMVPAMIVYFLVVEFQLLNLLIQIVSIAAVTLLAQAIACLLGWLLHLLLTKINKSVASVLYLVIFMVLYFTLYSRAGEILNAMAINGSAIADALKTWVWPLYAMGAGSVGKWWLSIAFWLICAAAFGLVYWLLSVTFLHSATTRKGSKRKQLNLSDIKASGSGQAILRKELRRFLRCPVYLTNMGIGILFTAALAAAGVIFRSTLLEQLGELAEVFQPYMCLVICALLAFMTSMTCISAPSVSLEGKNLWLLKSMPISPKEILLAKLKFHCIMVTPITVLAGWILAFAYGCSPGEILLVGIVPGLLTVICGLFGLICDLKWARFDWISEAYPCKQSLSLLVVMFSMMGVPLLLGVVYLLLQNFLSAGVFLLLCTVILCGAAFGLYRVLLHWGTQKWEQL